MQCSSLSGHVLVGCGETVPRCWLGMIDVPSTYRVNVARPPAGDELCFDWRSVVVYVTFANMGLTIRERTSKNQAGLTFVPRISSLQPANWFEEYRGTQHQLVVRARAVSATATAHALP